MLCGCGIRVHGGGRGSISPGVWRLRGGEGLVEGCWHGELACCHGEGSLVKRRVTIYRSVSKVGARHCGKSNGSLEDSKTA